MAQKKTIFSCNNYKCLIFLGLLLAYFELGAQNLRIELGSPAIALNEAFTISVESDGKPIEDFSPFPDIQGFKKVSSPSYATSKANYNTLEEDKQNLTVYIRTQTYHPLKEGTFRLNAFKMTVNGQEVYSEGTTLKVGPFDKKKGNLEEFNPEDLFSENEIKLIEVKEDAFLGLSLSKEAVYVGEGFTLSLALYVSETNRAPMQYVELSKQIEEISKTLKPSNCWEENFNIQDIPEPPVVNINGKNYLQYKFYEAAFFPFNTQAITFKKVGLTMKVKKRIDTNNPNEFTEQSETELKTFFTTPRTVIVKQLPKHPLREKVVAGNFYLQENIPAQIHPTGETFKYFFQISGDGNISAIQPPELTKNSIVEIYAPNSQQFINRGQGKVSGSMIFEYQIIPKEAGTYQFKDYFQWVYFNPASGKYDTLRPSVILKVQGESIRNTEISANQLNQFYKKIEQADNQLIDNSLNEQIKKISQVAFALMIIIMLVVSILGSRR
jgi:hypothetical protein